MQMGTEKDSNEVRQNRFLFFFVCPSQVGAFNIYTCAAGTECSPRARRVVRHSHFHPYPQGAFQKVTA